MYEPMSTEEALAFLHSVSTCPGEADYGVIFKEGGEIDWIFVSQKSRALKLRKLTGGRMFTRRLIEELVPVEGDDDA